MEILKPDELREKFDDPWIAPGEGWIKRYVDYAFLDDDLWVIAQNHEYRHRLMDFLVEHKIVVYVNDDATMAAEGLSLKQMLVMLLAI